MRDHLKSTMKYCKNCVMPDTRPGLEFDENGVCAACINFENQKKIDWDERWNQLEKLCDKYRGSNGNGYDCAIAVSGGKDSHLQTYLIKEKLKMNPVLITVGNVDWTNVGRKNLDNLSDTFGCDIIELHANIRANRYLTRKTFEEFGQSSWYIDSIIYAFPYRMAMQLGIKLLIYGEDVNFTYGGKQNIEKSSAMLQPYNDVVKPYRNEWIQSGEVTEKDLQLTIPPSIEECEKFGLDPIYMSYFIPWNSQHSFEVAKKWGFRHLGHEHKREGWLEDYDQIDTLSYLVNPYLKYLKFGHSVATDIGSRWIRYGIKSREEIIPLIEEKDGKLDQEIVDKFCEFTKMSISEFWMIMDKWYNRELFKQDRDGVWHPKFKVGVGLKK